MLISVNKHVYEKDTKAMIVIFITSLHVPGTIANTTLILSLKILIMTLYSKHHFFLLKKKNLFDHAT